MSEERERYIPRLPQVGERWRLHIRPGELICEACGYVMGTKGIEVGLQGIIVTIEGLDTGCSHCPMCDAGSYHTGGWVKLDIITPYGNPRRKVAAPYTWLEPIAEEQ